METYEEKGKIRSFWALGPTTISIPGQRFPAHPGCVRHGRTLPGPSTQVLPGLSQAPGCLLRHIPKEVNVDSPLGCFFIWLRLPVGVTSLDLLVKAAEEGVEFAPGARFSPEPSDGEPNLLSQMSEAIDEGIRRLGRAIKGMVVRLK